MQAGDTAAKQGAQTAAQELTEVGESASSRLNDIIEIMKEGEKM